MGVDKVILRSFLSTLAAIFLLLVFMVAALCAFFPSTMMNITYDLGMESSSIHFAERAYNGSEDIYYIAYATEVAIEEDKNDKILSCGKQFITDEGFDGYCALKGANYEQFIYGQVYVAMYEQGDKANAVSLAYESLGGGFPRGNALVAVLIAAFEQNDGATVTMIGEKLADIRVEGDEETYLQETLQVIGA